MFPKLFWLILLAAALGCIVGFKKFVWFLSVGYGLAMSLVGVVLFALGAGEGACLPYLLLCLVLVGYGLRLGLFILLRELRNDAYRKTLASAGGEAVMPAPVLACTWLLCAFLYYMQSSGLFYRYANGMADTADAWLWAGLAVSLLGFILEAAADRQKSAQKKENPDMVATKGLFRYCRCPNYFGEILVWTGVLLSALPVLRGWQWLIALLGYVCIVYIMFNGAQRLEKRQIRRCWRMPEYAEYADKTPILIPFLPIYHLVDWRR